MVDVVTGKKSLAFLLALSHAHIDRLPVPHPAVYLPPGLYGFLGRQEAHKVKSSAMAIL